jgi:hypothetical protein
MLPCLVCWPGMSLGGSCNAPCNVLQALPPLQSLDFYLYKDSLLGFTRPLPVRSQTIMNEFDPFILNHNLIACIA